MLTVISPAKRLDEGAFALPPGLDATTPAFAAEAAELAAVARALPVAGLRRLMGLSEPLARLNAGRFAAFGAQPAKPAALIFAGDTYAGLEARTLDEGALRWAQGRLRILSGLYGLLRPLDVIEPYRLEMGSRLANARGADLYAFWGDRIARALDAAADAAGARVLLNCASQEYFGAVDRAALRLPVVTPVFLDARDGADGKVISFWAKRARGAMARFVMENRLEDAGDLRAFATGGYAWQADLSAPDRPVFLRQAEARAVS